MIKTISFGKEGIMLNSDVSTPGQALTFSELLKKLDECPKEFINSPVMADGKKLERIVMGVDSIDFTG